MIIAGKEIGIKKQPFALLKKNVCDDAIDMEDMINRNKDFEDGMDYVMNMDVKKSLNKFNDNSNRSLFTQETVRATTAKVFGSASQGKHQNNEEYER